MKLKEYFYSYVIGTSYGGTLIYDWHNLPDNIVLGEIDFLFLKRGTEEYHIDVFDMHYSDNQTDANVRVKDIIFKFSKEAKVINLIKYCHDMGFI